MLAAALQQIFQHVLAATRYANALPKLGDNYELYASYPAFSKVMDVEGRRVLELYSSFAPPPPNVRSSLTKVFRQSGLKTNFAGERLDDDARTERLVDCNDALLERIVTP